MGASSQIVVLDGYAMNPGDNPWDAVARLGRLVVYDRTPADQIVERAREARIVLMNKTPLTRETMSLLPNLRLIGVLATGYNVVDVAAASERGIIVSNVPEYGSDTVAQFTIAMLLELCHRIGLHDESVHSGQWQTNPDWCYWKTPQIELAGRTLGVVGLGRIGRRVAEIGSALGMSIIANSLPPVNGQGLRNFRTESLQQLFQQSDVVTLHCPQTPQNTKMVDRALLAQMKPGALLINCSRGGLINETDLAEALNAGVLAGAAVDVVSVEPIREENPLLTAKNCIITPHMAWSTLEARRRIMQRTAENIEAFLAGRPINVVTA